MVAEKTQLNGGQSLRFGFSIEEGMGANTSMSVLLPRSVETVIVITGPGNLSIQHTSTSDYIQVSIPDIAEVGACGMKQIRYTKRNAC